MLGERAASYNAHQCAQLVVICRDRQHYRHFKVGHKVLRGSVGAPTEKCACMLQPINMCKCYTQEIGRLSKLWLVVYLSDHSCDNMTSWDFADSIRHG